jgi:cation diffusion facilitator family transporter
MEDQDRMRTGQAGRRAILISLVTGLAMFAGKMAAWLLTGSAAIFSDAAESVVHVVAVAFAAASFFISQRPRNARFLYGYERLAFFSAGFEGLMIVLAAVAIMASAIQKWLAGIPLENLGEGVLITLAASLVNLALGWYLVRTGRRTNSLILVANGKHVLTDSWTSFGVVGGLALVLITEWRPFDPILAIAVAINILFTGGRLMRDAVRGLLDFADPAVAERLQQTVSSLCDDMGIEWHGLRFRSTGQRLVVLIHLPFPQNTSVGEAHRLATEFEERLPERLQQPVEVITHIESAEDHETIHRHEMPLLHKERPH